LDVLAPIFRRVVAIDRSEAQLSRAQRRIAGRGYSNVQLLHAELDELEVTQAVGEGADLVVAARVLHHAPKPRATVALLARWLKRGGQLVVIDYQRHSDESFRERQADVWNGFEPDDLRAYALGAELENVDVQPLPRGFVQNPMDGHLSWLVLVAEQPKGRARADAVISRSV
jgi:ArsR family transcriptional regulator